MNHHAQERTFSRHNSTLFTSKTMIMMSNQLLKPSEST
ncbi:hypothetical protein LINPERHAP1_LOCUS5291 [Linum perenne]